MNNFLNKFSTYEGSAPPGVRLPEIKITKANYKSLNLDEGTSNFDFLRELCLKGVKDKGIDRLPNKKEYYDRTKEELKILNELGFIDYILLNWDILDFCHKDGIPTGPGSCLLYTSDAADE